MPSEVLSPPFPEYLCEDATTAVRPRPNQAIARLLFIAIPGRAADVKMGIGRPCKHD